MAQLVVRNLDEGVKANLRARAARNGNSLEQEVRNILSAATDAEPKQEGLGTRLARRFAGMGLTEPLETLPFALPRRASIATRDVRHFEDLEIPVLNPWAD
jgi:plasmid stability protein